MSRLSAPGAAAALLLAGCGGADELPGNITVGAYYVPTETLAAFAADRRDGFLGPAWVTPNFALEPANNPHRLVVDFEGRLGADVAVAENLFEVVWLIKQDRQTGGPAQRLRFDRANLQVSGNVVKGRAVTPPLSFREADLAALELSLERHVGLAPTAMTLSVRAGMEGASALEWFFSARVLMVGLVFLGLAWWLRR